MWEVLLLSVLKITECYKLNTMLIKICVTSSPYAIADIHIFKSIIGYGTQTFDATILLSPFKIQLIRLLLFHTRMKNKIIYA